MPATSCTQAGKSRSGKALLSTVQKAPSLFSHAADTLAAIASGSGRLGLGSGLGVAGDNGNTRWIPPRIGSRQRLNEVNTADRSGLRHIAGGTGARPAPRGRSGMLR
ncbi:hypothetical protein GCM10023074_22780 [Microbispora amethystogenes]|uniref:Uncharacterized protein n=1 Tax=Microbispora amethystogenes TaxID=1427754 RepID=A0ABQ4F939_9ACTN|nr:hypothetical protein Mam01_15010 [Microbispora amethystogenes]